MSGPHDPLFVPSMLTSIDHRIGQQNLDRINQIPTNVVRTIAIQILEIEFDDATRTRPVPTLYEADQVLSLQTAYFFDGIEANPTEDLGDGWSRTTPGADVVHLASDTARGALMLVLASVDIPADLQPPDFEPPQQLGTVWTSAASYLLRSMYDPNVEYR